MRAKRALDRLSALVAPTATVVRDGRPRPLHVDEVVPGDLVRLAPGDQLVADGRLVSAEGLALDESILSGESAPVRSGAGAEVRSGSFAVEGRGSYVVEAVGADSYAERIAGEARAFRHPRSPLELAFNRLLLGLVGVMIPLGAVLGVSLEKRDASLDDTVSTSVAAVVSLVPEGLMVLASLTYAVAALRMSRRGALAQQLNAIESLAAVDVICTDKTGTLTEAAAAGCRRGAGARNPGRRADPCARGLRRQLAGAQRHAGGGGRGVPARSRSRSRARCPSRPAGAGARWRSPGAPTCSAPRSCFRSAHWRRGSRRSSAAGGGCSLSRPPTRRRRRTIPQPCPPSWSRSACWCSPSGCVPTRARPWSSSAHRASS